MRYFEMTFISQKSKHPDGAKEFNILIEGETKKAAIESAKEWLAEEEPETHEFYRVPVANEISEEEYNADDEEEAEEPTSEEKDPADNETFYDDFSDKNEDETPEDKAARLASEKAESDAKKAKLLEPELEYFLFCKVNEMPVLITVDSVVDGDNFRHNFEVKIIAKGNGYTETGKGIGRSNFTRFQTCMDSALELVDDMLGDIRKSHPDLSEQVALILEFMGDDSEGFLGRNRVAKSVAMTTIEKYQKCVIDMSSGEVAETFDQEISDDDFTMDNDFGDFGDDDFGDFREEQEQEPEGDAHLQIDIGEQISREISEGDHEQSDGSIELTIEDVNAMIDELEPDQSFTLYDLPNDVYHGSNGYSKSKLDIVAKDAGLLEWAVNAPQDEDKMAELNMGTAVHACVLEPHLYETDYVVKKKVNGATKEGKAYNAEFAAAREVDGLEVLTEEEDKKINLMSGSLRAHPKAAQLLKSGAAEVSIFWRCPDTNIVFKIRIDWLTSIGKKPVIFDVKTIDKPEQFEKSVAEFRYHVQDAFYSWVFTKATKTAPLFLFGVIGKHINCGKYPVRLCMLDTSDVEEGMEQSRKSIEILSECIETDRWGGFQVVTRPAWAKKNDLTK